MQCLAEYSHIKCGHRCGNNYLCPYIRGGSHYRSSGQRLAGRQQKPGFDDNEDSSGSSDWSSEVQESHQNDPGGGPHCHPSPVQPCCPPRFEEKEGMPPSSLDDCLLHWTLRVLLPSPCPARRAGLRKWRQQPPHHYDQHRRGLCFPHMQRTEKKSARAQTTTNWSLSSCIKTESFFYQMLDIQTPNCYCHVIRLQLGLNCQKCQLLSINLCGYIKSHVYQLRNHFLSKSSVLASSKPNCQLSSCPPCQAINFCTAMSLPVFASRRLVSQIFCFLFWEAISYPSLSGWGGMSVRGIFSYCVLFDIS